jgi:DNA-binding LacI/PurR family transcriptional regulator
VSQDLRARIEASVAALGYVPRQAGQRLSEGTLALLAGDLLNPFFPEIVRGVQDEVDSLGLILTLYNLTDHPQRQSQLLCKLSKPRVEGAILTGSSPFPELLEWQARHKIPLVLLNRHVKQPGVHCIMVDFENAMYRATQHLLNLNHTRIGHLASPSTGEIAQARQRGIEAALAEAGLTLRPEWRPIVPPGTEVEGGFQAMRALLGLPADERPTAIIAFNDIIALGALHAVRVYGLNVPQDISIVGVDDIAVAAHTYPPLTTIGQPKYRMGKLAVQTLRRMCEGRLSAGNNCTLLESPLIVRESTGPAPQTS